MVNITPTLFIGLGGTGMEILTGVRRLFFERYGRHEVACIEYLCIDTDRRQTRSKFYPPDHISESIQFRPGEVVWARVPQQAVAEYFEHPETYPHVFSWLSRGAFKFGPAAITEGAGQYRPFGRLALFHAYKDVRKAIAGKLNRIASEATIQQVNREDPAFNVRPTDRGVKVFVISSIAGGTGAGMCLDVPFLVRDVASETSGELGLLTSYLVLPDVFVQAEDIYELTVEERRKMQANGYAALKELEYYSRLGTVGEQRLRRFDSEGAREAVFSVQWAVDEPIRSFYQLPFDICNLVGNANSAGIDLNSARDVVDLVAERIYLDFDEGGFTAQREQREANVKQTYSLNFPLQYEDQAGRPIYSNPFSCRFSSFAISKIYLDRMRLRHVGAYDLAMMLVARLAEGAGVPTGAAEQAGREMNAELDELQVGLDELEQALIGRIIEQVGSEFGKPDAPAYRQLAEALRHSAEPASPRDWKKIGATLSTFMKKRRGELVEWLERTLEQRPDSIGIPALAEFLGQLKSRVERHRAAGADLPVPPDATLLDRVAKLAQAEQLPGLPPGFRRYASDRMRAACAEEAENYGRAVISRLLRSHAATELYGPLSAELDRAQGRLQRARSALVELVDQTEEATGNFGLRHHRGELLKVAPSPRNLLLSDDPNLAASVRKALAGDGDEAVLCTRIDRLIARFRAALTELDRSVTSFVAYGRDDHSIHYPDLRTRLIHLAYDALDGFLAEHSAAELLVQRFGEEQAKQRLEERMSACRPFVRLQEGFVLQWMKSRIAPLTYCGFNRTGEKAALVERTISSGELRFGPVDHDPDSILFLHIIDGLPLCAIEQVRAFHKAYRELLADPRFSASSWHLDKQASRFPEVIAQSREAALAEIALMKAVLAGVVLRQIRWNVAAASFSYRYLDTSGVVRQEQTIDCGATLAAVLATFEARPELREPLQADYNRWNSDCLARSDGIHELVRFYLTLRYYQAYVYRPLASSAGDPEHSEAIPTRESVVTERLIVELEQVMRRHNAYHPEEVDTLAARWKHWLESFTRFEGGPEKYLTLYAVQQDADGARLTLLHHNQVVLGKSELELTSLSPMNPLDSNPVPTEAWNRQWAGAGLRPAEAPAGQPGPTFNPWAESRERPVSADEADQRAADETEGEPDPFSAL